MSTKHSNKAGFNTAANISLINIETLLDASEADFSSWAFFENALYDTVLNTVKKRTSKKQRVLKLNQ